MRRRDVFAGTAELSARRLYWDFLHVNWSAAGPDGLSLNSGSPTEYVCLL